MGDVIPLVPFPVLDEGNPPEDALKLTAYLDEFVAQRLHFAKQAMYPGRRVLTDEFLWTLCHHKLVELGLAHSESAAYAEAAALAHRRAPVSEDFRFSKLYHDVYMSHAQPTDAPEPTEEPGQSEQKCPANRLALVSETAFRKFMGEVTSDDARFAYLDKLSHRMDVPLAPAPSEAHIAELYKSCPNFSAVIDFVLRHAALCRAGGVAFSMPPVLLLGPPGVGKTHFARQLAKCLAVDYRFVSMNSVSAGFTLTGMHRTWQRATPGLVARTLLESKVGNPLFLLDEIDKCASHSHHGNPVDSLYQLLEPETSTAFSDEFFEMPMDASKALWIATANEIRGLPEPITDRLVVFELEELSADQTLFIAKQLLGGALENYRLREFTAELDLESASLLVTLSARNMRTLIPDAIGNALRDGRNHLTKRDLEVAKRLVAPSQRSIGFIG